MLNKKRILEYLEEAGKPVYEEQLFSDMEISKETAPIFYDIITELENSGKIIKTKKNKYALPEKMGLILGIINTSPKGFGFVSAHDTKIQDIFIPASEIQTAMHGDLVYCKIIDQSQGMFKAEGTIVKVIKRANEHIVGTFQKQKNYGFVVPDNAKIFNDVFVSKNDFGGAKNGQKVVVEIQNWGCVRSLPSGKIIEVLGHINEKGVDILSVIRKYKLPEHFGKDVVKEAINIPDKVSEADIKDRKDYRDKDIVTIDGVDAKDLDDAVYLERDGAGNYLLSVHIADVAHYVKRKTLIDQEALKRGNSVYLIDRVIPMLPESLSNGICSLNEGVDRLTMSLEMVFSEDGELRSHEIHEGVIRSKKRLNYDEVSELIDKGSLAPGSKISEPIQKMLFEMKDLADLLYKKRRDRGAISFDFSETYITLDDEGFPIEIRDRERGVSDKIIEEFMLIANETIAEYVYWLEIPFVYRVHEQPDMERIDSLNKFVSRLGYRLHVRDSKVHPKEVQELLNRTKGKPSAKVINKMMLRSLKQARYSTECLGHFGLSAKYYCHFTSPIRRYPDLEIHRILKEDLKNEITDDRLPVLKEEVERVSDICSSTEKTAEGAEREVDDMKMCQFMEPKIGEEFDAVISGVSKSGIYSELENTVEGFTKVSSLDDDYYSYDETTLSLIGDRTAKKYTIGDEIRVRLTRVDVLQREIDFEIIENGNPGAEKSLRKKVSKKPKKKNRKKKMKREF